jgi:hypothetical protein
MRSRVEASRPPFLRNALEASLQTLVRANSEDIARQPAEERFDSAHPEA